MTQDFSRIRREYGARPLTAQRAPLEMCEQWLAEALQSEQTDPTAMVLSTVDAAGMPDARVVLLKAIRADGFVFYTHFDSQKGLQLATHPVCALTMYWPVLARQLRIRGTVKPLSTAENDAYFASRPYESQLSAMVSKQSQIIESREVLETAIEQLRQQPTADTLRRPDSWGGYVVTPCTIEFWQGRDSRLHDRLRFEHHDHHWTSVWLAP